MCILLSTNRNTLRAVFLQPYKSFESRVLVKNCAVKIHPLPGINNFLVWGQTSNASVTEWWIATVYESKQYISVKRTEALDRYWQVIGFHPIAGLGHLVCTSILDDKRQNKPDKPHHDHSAPSSETSFLYWVKFNHQLVATVEAVPLDVGDDEDDDKDCSPYVGWPSQKMAFFPTDSADYTLADLIYCDSSLRRHYHRKQRLALEALANRLIVYVRKDHDILYDCVPTGRRETAVWSDELDASVRRARRETEVWKYNLTTGNTTRCFAPAMGWVMFGHDADFAYNWRLQQGEDDGHKASSLIIGCEPIIAGTTMTPSIAMSHYQKQRRTVTIGQWNRSSVPFLEGSVHDFEDDHKILVSSSRGEVWLVDFVKRRYHQLVAKFADPLSLQGYAMNVSAPHAIWAAVVLQHAPLLKDVMRLTLSYCLGYVPLLEV